MWLTVRPVFLRTPRCSGWVLRVIGDGAPRCLGGTPYASPGEAVDRIGPSVRAAYPAARIAFKPASPAQMRKALA